MLMKSIFELTGRCLLSCSMMVTAAAAAAGGNTPQGSLDDPDDPVNLLPSIQLRGTQKTSLFPASPLSWLHDSTTCARALAKTPWCDPMVARRRSVCVTCWRVLWFRSGTPAHRGGSLTPKSLLIFLLTPPGKAPASGRFGLSQDCLSETARRARCRSPRSGGREWRG